MYAKHLVILFIGIGSMIACKSERAIREEKARSFQLAVIEGDYPTVNRLLAEGVNLQIEGTSALMTAATTGNLPITQLLLDRGVKADAELISGATVLSEVLNQVECSQRKDVIDLLLARHANASVVGRGRMTPIELAAGNCDAQVVQKLLESRVDPNQFGKQSALELAATRRDLKMVTELLKAGADPNRYGEVPPLIAAMQSGGRFGGAWSLPIVKILLKYKADPNSSLRGDSAAQIAKIGVEASVYKTLLDAGAEPPGSTTYETELEKESAALREQIAVVWST